MDDFVLVAGASCGYGQTIARDLVRDGHNFHLPTPAAVSYGVIDRVREQCLARIGHSELLHPFQRAK